MRVHLIEVCQLAQNGLTGRRFGPGSAPFRCNSSRIGRRPFRVGRTFEKFVQFSRSGLRRIGTKAVRIWRHMRVKSAAGARASHNDASLPPPAAAPAAHAAGARPRPSPARVQRRVRSRHLISSERSLIPHLQPVPRAPAIPGSQLCSAAQGARYSPSVVHGDLHRRSPVGGSQRRRLHPHSGGFHALAQHDRAAPRRVLLDQHQLPRPRPRRRLPDRLGQRRRLQHAPQCVSAAPDDSPRYISLAASRRHVGAAPPGLLSQHHLGDQGQVQQRRELHLLVLRHRRQHTVQQLRRASYRADVALCPAADRDPSLSPSSCTR